MHARTHTHTHTLVTWATCVRHKSRNAFHRFETTPVVMYTLYTLVETIYNLQIV